MKKTLVHIPRPNQSFHVGFALISAFSLVIKLDKEVDILICDDSYADCPVKTLFGKKLYYGSCNECEGTIKYIEELVAHFKKNLDANDKLTVYKTSDFMPKEREFAKNEKSKSVLDQFKSNYRDISESNDMSGYYINHTWISELCTLTSATAYDIAYTNVYDEAAMRQIGLAERTKKIARAFLKGKSYDRYIIYNGRHTGGKSFWFEFRKKNPNASYFVHEIGLAKDSFSILNGVSNEDHFELLPKEYFPLSTAKSSINRWKESNNQLTKIGFNNYVDYMNSRLDGTKNFYGNKVPIEYTKSMITKSNENILIMLSSYDEVSIPYPVDRVLYEQKVMPNLIKALGELGYKVHVRLHPRSSSQYENSERINGTYNTMVNKIRVLTNNQNIYLYMPRDSVSSYDLMKKCRYVISLFSIAAIEAQSIGCVSLVHSRCRGNHAATGRILGFTSKDAIDTATRWLEEYKNITDKSEILRKSRLEARKFLGEDLFGFSYKLPQFFSFSPYENNSWMEAMINSTCSVDYYKNPLIDRLIEKYDEKAFIPFTGRHNS